MDTWRSFRHYWSVSEAFISVGSELGALRGGGCFVVSGGPCADDLAGPRAGPGADVITGRHSDNIAGPLAGPLAGPCAADVIAGRHSDDLAGPRAGLCAIDVIAGRHSDDLAGPRADVMVGARAIDLIAGYRAVFRTDGSSARTADRFAGARSSASRSRPRNEWTNGRWTTYNVRAGVCALYTELDSTALGSRTAGCADASGINKWSSVHAERQLRNAGRAESDFIVGVCAHGTKLDSSSVGTPSSSADGRDSATTDNWSNCADDDTATGSDANDTNISRRIPAKLERRLHNTGRAPINSRCEWLLLAATRVKHAGRCHRSGPGECTLPLR
jgi:hypothetical protein